MKSKIHELIRFTNKAVSKNKILFTLFSVVLIGSANAQLPFNYSIDSTSFNTLTLEGGMTQIRFADVNKDGFLDIVSIGDHGSPYVNTNQHGITVWFGNGTGTNWGLYQNGDFGYGGCAVGDLNNDGKQDIAYSLHHDYSSTDFGDQLIEAAMGDGTGMNWTPYDDGLAANGESWGMFGTDIGDVNDDGWLDIGSNSFGSGQGIHIYKNNSNGTWTQTYQYGSGNTGKYFQFGDIDGDGYLDFVAPNHTGATFFGTGNGSFTLKKSGLPSNSSGVPYGDVCLADIDNDGDDDFAFTYRYSGTSSSGVYVYKWNKTFQQWVNASAGLPVGGYSTENFNLSRLVDIDMDGYADLLTASDSLDEFQIWKGNGGTSWTKMAAYHMNALMGVQDVVVADLDHSGYPDILACATFLGGGPFNPTTYNKYKLFMDNADPNTMSSSLLYPKGNECWHNNAVKFIHWTGAIPGNHASSVKIEYSSAGNSGPWTFITASAPNNGTYQWTVPSSVVSSNCFIRVTITDNVTSNTSAAINTVPFNIGCNASTTAVAETSLSTISVFPNPFSESLIISIPDFSGAIVKLYDLLGNVVQTSKIETENTKLERNNIVSGIYILEIQSGNKTERIKLIAE